MRLLNKILQAQLEVIEAKSFILEKFIYLPEWGLTTSGTCEKRVTSQKIGDA